MTEQPSTLAAIYGLGQLPGAPDQVDYAPR